jgi:hypothetical protein
MNEIAAHAAQLVFGAPTIAPGEDWRGRSLRCWVNLATREEGLTVESTDDGGVGDSGTWCGNVRVAGVVLRIHRGGHSCGNTTRRTPWGVVGDDWKPLGPPVERDAPCPGVWAEVTAG